MPADGRWWNGVVTMTDANHAENRPSGPEIGGYKVLGRIGEGGMGLVLRAHDARLDRPVALKVLHPHLSRDEEFAGRFLREARTAAKLEHPSIVQVYTAGEDGGQCYIAMQLVEGVELGRLMQGGSRLPVHVAILIAREVASALAAAHATQVVHRDVKPANIMATASGGVKVMDFGLARPMRGGSRYTETGTYLGTPEYSAPEQCVSDEIDHRADLYSLGVVLYEMLSATVPHTGDTPYALFKRIVEEPALPLRHLVPETPAPILDLVDRLLAKDPAERCQDAKEVVATLDELLAGFRGGIVRAREDLARLVAEAGEEAKSEHAKTLVDPDPASSIVLEDESGRATSRRASPTYHSGLSRTVRRTLVMSALVLLGAAGALLLGFLAFGPGPSGAGDDGTSAGGTNGTESGDQGAEAPRPEAIPLLGEDGRVTVAVFDFRNLEKREDLEWMRVSLTEMLITTLSRCSALAVLTRDRVQEEIAAQTARTGDSPLDAVARALRAGLAVRGNIVPVAQGHVKVVVEVMREGRHLQSQEEVGSEDEIFRLVDRLSARVLRMIEEYLQSETGQLSLAPAANDYRLAQDVDCETAYRERQGRWADRDRTAVREKLDEGQRRPSLDEFARQMEELEELKKLADPETPQDTALPDGAGARMDDPGHGGGGGIPETSGGSGGGDGENGAPGGLAGGPDQGKQPGDADPPAPGEFGAAGAEDGKGASEESFRHLFNRYVDLFRAYTRRLGDRPPLEPQQRMLHAQEGEKARWSRSAQFFAQNNWKSVDEDQVALRSHGQAKAMLERADLSGEELELCLELLELAEEMGYPREEIDTLRATCQERGREQEEVPAKE
ncbi:MAG: protein kinase [Planctomycetes bacterium]|nr:protein kinase [Planctomycetota bacterium]